MMNIHREGRLIVFYYFLILLVLNVALYYFFVIKVLSIIVGILSVAFLLIVLNFYRNPKRKFKGDATNAIVSSADGKVVTIEEVYEGEYFKENRLLVSVFMSPFNVHANWYPITGKVIKSLHHNGRFMAAYLPKSSTENERSTVVLESEDGKHQILLRQIAGAMARRIVTYAKDGDPCHIDQQLGFIKLGSRVDLYLPLGTDILVSMDEKVTGNQTVIGRFPK